MSPCPHSGASTERDRGIDRREFMKTALVIGGTNALAAVKARGHDGHTSPPRGADDLSTLPDRQFAWNDFSSTNETTGLAKTPKHHLQFMLDYTGNGQPTDVEREQVENALQTLERAFEWSNEGLLFTIGYSPSYFDRYDADLPADTGLLGPETVIEESDINRSGQIAVDDYDAHMHLASDTVVALLEAEEALFGSSGEIATDSGTAGATSETSGNSNGGSGNGNGGSSGNGNGGSTDGDSASGDDSTGTINGVEIQATFEGVFEKRDRRTGFIGNPHDMWEEHVDGENPVDEDASVWFGFKSLFADSQPTEDDVAITDPDHPFQGGTTEEASVLRDEGLQEWHNSNSLEERVERMFSPRHAPDDTGPHGRDLGETSGTDAETMNEIAAETKADADEKGVVGHAQKLARARKGEDNTPPLLRRDFPSTDGNRPRTQFISNQRTIQDFIDVRRAMAFVDHDEENPNAESEVPIKNHGIQGRFQVESRGTFLVPPRSLRALPPANP